MRNPMKGHAALRRGRVSIPHAEYFLTVCTEAKRPGLASPAVAPAILAEMRAMDADHTWQLRCAVVMPDHIHVLAILGERLTLGQSIGRLKTKTKPTLVTRDATLEWERDFYDHHVRPDEDRLAIFLYVFLNPYRAGQCARSELWPWYFCRDEDWQWFKNLLDSDCPHPEWLL
jgi:REP element-mobilizing transposase RayT